MELRLVLEYEVFVESTVIIVQKRQKERKDNIETDKKIGSIY